MNPDSMHVVLIFICLAESINTVHFQFGAHARFMAHPFFCQLKEIFTVTSFGLSTMVIHNFLLGMWFCVAHFCSTSLTPEGVILKQCPMLV